MYRFLDTKQSTINNNNKKKHFNCKYVFLVFYPEEMNVYSILITDK